MPIFDSKSLHDAISTQLKESNIPDDHNNALAFIATKSGVKTVYTQKINDEWQINGMLGVDKEKHVDGGFELIRTWK